MVSNGVEENFFASQMPNLDLARLRMGVRKVCKVFNNGGVYKEIQTQLSFIWEAEDDRRWRGDVVVFRFRNCKRRRVIERVYVLTNVRPHTRRRIHEY